MHSDNRKNHKYRMVVWPRLILLTVCLTSQLTGGLAFAQSNTGAHPVSTGSAEVSSSEMSSMVLTLQKQIAEQQVMLQTLQQRLAEQKADRVVTSNGETGSRDKLKMSDATDKSAMGLPLQSAGVAPTQPSAPTAASDVHSVSQGAEATPPTQADEPTTASAPAPSNTASQVDNHVPATSSPVVEPAGTGINTTSALPSAPAVIPSTQVSVSGVLTPAQREAYASGVTVWREIESSMASQRALGMTLDPQYVMQGIQDMYTKQPLKLSRDAIDTIMTTLNQQYLEKAKDVRDMTESQGRAYRVAFSKQKGARSDAGSWYQVVSAGNGRKLRASDMVVLSVTGTLPDGTVFDPSGQNGQTKTVKVGALLPAVAIGLQKVSPGGHIKIVVPPEKGYGDAGLPPAIPGGATLIFDIQVDTLAG